MSEHADFEDTVINSALLRPHQAQPPVAGSATGSATRDVIKSTLPKKENRELARELLDRFPKADRAELLEDMVAWCFCEMRWGNKREERAACEFLNELQRIAIRNSIRKPSDMGFPISQNIPPALTEPPVCGNSDTTARKGDGQTGQGGAVSLNAELSDRHANNP